MATATTASSKLSLKLLINKISGKVLFAEAGKDFIDFLLGLLALPIGRIVHLLGESRMVGSLAKLHGSLQSLSSGNYLRSGFDKDLLLRPRVGLTLPTNASLLQHGDEASSRYTSGEEVVFYTCNSGCRLWTDTRGRKCACGCQMNTEARILSSGGQGVGMASSETGEESSGYVKGVVTYMVMDDLVVAPMSTISSITLLNKFNVKEVGALEEKVVQVSMDEGLKMLEVSLYSKTVLTDVLLKKK